MQDSLPRESREFIAVRHKSQVTWLIVQHVVKTDNKENTKALHNWPKTASNEESVSIRIQEDIQRTPLFHDLNNG